MSNYFKGALVAISLSLCMTSVFAGDKPPKDSMPLSEVVKSLEEKGYSPITDVSMDDDMWEVEAYIDGKEHELKVNPRNAEIISDHPDD